MTTRIKSCSSCKCGGCGSLIEVLNVSSVLISYSFTNTFGYTHCAFDSILVELDQDSCGAGTGVRECAQDMYSYLGAGFSIDSKCVGNSRTCNYLITAQFNYPSAGFFGDGYTEAPLGDLFGTHSVELFYPYKGFPGATSIGFASVTIS